MPLDGSSLSLRSDDDAASGPQGKEEILKRLESLEEDGTNFFSFKVSGVTVTRLVTFAKKLVSKAEKLGEDLLLDDQLTEDEKVEANTKVQLVLKSARNYVRACDELPDELPVTNVASSSSHHAKKGTHLQRLQLPVFRGDIREWTNWWSRYDKAVHSDTERDDGEKLQYFELALEGEPLEFLNGYSKTPEDYPVIVKNFQERYSNVDLLAQAYNQDLLAIPAPTGGWKEQRATLDEIMKILTCLRKIGTAVNEDSIRGLILQKFPEPTLAAAYSEAQLSRLINVLAEGSGSLTRDALEPTIDCLRLPLDTLLDAIKRALLRQEFFAQAKKSDSDPATAITLVATTPGGSNPKTSGGGGAKRSKSSKVSTCQLCKRENHRAASCRLFRTVAQRKSQADKLQLCYNCLSADHLVSACTNKRPCQACGKGTHHPAICAEAVAAKKNAVTSPADSNKSGTFLQTFIGQVTQGNSRCTVRGFLDNGSDTSYILSSLLQRANFKAGPPTMLDVLKFATLTTTPIPSRFVHVTLSNLSGTSREVTLRTTDCILANTQLAPPPHRVRELLSPDLQYADEDLFALRAREIEIMIGSDLYYEFVHLNGHKRLENGVVLLRSFFGWIPAGCGTQYSLGNVRKRKLALTVSAGTPVKIARSISDEEKERNRELDRKLELLWSLEVLGVRPLELRDKNDAVLASFKETTRLENGRYVVRFPRIKENFSIPTNYRQCVARLKGMFDRMTPQLKRDLHDHLLSQEAAGVLERAPSESHHTTHYLPYKVIIRKERMRVVHDASAKTKTGASLNDMLHAGPSLVKDLVGIMIRFRMNPIALLADIEKAFLQLGLDEADRDLVRFLAPLNPDQPFDPKSLVVFRFARVPFGVVSAPFLMNMVLQTHLAAASESSPEGEAKWYRLARHSFYIDNLVLSVDHLSEAVEVHEVLTANLKRAGFNLREWISNSPEFNSTFADQTVEPPANPMPVLGMNWDRVSDRLSLKFETGKEIVKVTKRVALQTYAEVFDPMGLFAPCVLNLKAFIQECWTLGFGWDDVLPAKMEARFRKLKLERDAIAAVGIPRLLWSSPVRSGRYNLHIFCDASKRAYGCVHYLVKEDENSHLREAALIFSKLRLAPRKFLPLDQLAEKPTRPHSRKLLKAASEMTVSEVERTIPQLELMGATLAVRTAKHVLTQLTDRGILVGTSVLWTDATTVLQWLNTAAVLPQFTENRLKEIRATPNLTVRYVPTKANPADYLTRGKVVGELDELWFRGPQWLVQERIWPASPPNAPQFSTLAAPRISAASKTVPRFLLLTDSLEQKFSHWATYVRWFSALRKNVFRTRIAHLSPTAEYHRAEIALLKAMQLKYFPLELTQLKNKIQPRTSLSLFLDDDGLIRCYGRLQHADLPYDAIHPIYLPRTSRLVDLLLFSCHNQNGHVGAAHLLATFRQRFWVLKGRSKANSVVHRCTICRRNSGGPYQLPSMPPLPPIRVENAEPFLNVGVDCFGPFYVRLPVPTPAVTYTKMYGVIFACLVTRAIHLEIVGDLSGDQFLQAFMRFTSRRGVPVFVLSDNGTNFVFVQPLIGSKVKLTHEQLNQYFVSNKISWVFIPALSPWYGGVYERLIGLVKKSLHKMLGPYVASYSSLNTAFCTVENILNNRPLTYVSSTDTVEALTPNHFLRLRKRNPAAELELIEDPAETKSKADDMVQGYLASRHLIETFRVTFHKLYLTALRDAHVRLHRAKRGAVTLVPQPGAVVLVEEQSAPRAKWPIGVIESVDRRQAQATVRIVNVDHTTRLLTPLKKTFPTQVITRPVCRLYPFETSLSFDAAPAPVAPSAPSSSLSSPSSTSA